jgi:hypothetical protein
MLSASAFLQSWSADGRRALSFLYVCGLPATQFPDPPLLFRISPRKDFGREGVLYNRALMHCYQLAHGT